MENHPYHIVDRDYCKRKGLHNSRVFVSAFSYKEFCYYCMKEIDMKEVNEDGC